MVEYCKNNLREIESVLKNMGELNYKTSIKLLSGGTIGQHVRHILEFYLSLVNGTKVGKINYDKRERNLLLESDIKFGIFTIEKICSNLYHIKQDKGIDLEGNYSTEENEPIIIKSSLNRELAYCLEHSIHHQALIKIALIELNLQGLINPNFGVAPATIRHLKKCVQ